MPGRKLIACLGLWCIIITAPLHKANAQQQPTLTALYDFTDGSDGAGPIGGVISDAAGTLYGETDQGGSAVCPPQYILSLEGCGTIYSFSTASGFKVLASFDGANGSHGDNGLALAGKTLYGSTAHGGAADAGVVFSVATDGSAYTILHQFSGSDGYTPVSTLRFGYGGVLYGITEFGGIGYPATNNGVLFSLKPNGIYTVLHAFTGGLDGGVPNVLLISKTGVLVGSTSFGGTISHACSLGCGIIFQYTPSTAKFAVLHTFDGSSQGGGDPFVGSIGPGPTVYGDTGFVFSLGSLVGFDHLANFGFYEAGAVASGPFLASDGSLVGVEGSSQQNGSTGILYRVKNGVLTSLTGFGGATIGADPLAQPILTSSGSIIGTTTQEAMCPSCGSIWKYTQ